MRLLFATAVVASLLPMNSRADDLSTSCSVRGGTGYGYVKNNGTDVANVSGNIWFHFYDQSGSNVGNSLRSVVATVFPGARKLIGEHDAPSAAVDCEIEL